MHGEATFKWASIIIIIVIALLSKNLRSVTFKKAFECSPRLHLFDQKTVKSEIL